MAAGDRYKALKSQLESVRDRWLIATTEWGQDAEGNSVELLSAIDEFSSTFKAVS